MASYGLFDPATSENTVKMLKETIQKYGRPSAILSDRGSQFYATEAVYGSPLCSAVNHRLSGHTLVLIQLSLGKRFRIMSREPS
jgi:hypothetical protein